MTQIQVASDWYREDLERKQLHTAEIERLVLQFEALEVEKHRLALQAGNSQWMQDAFVSILPGLQLYAQSLVQYSAELRNSVDRIAKALEPTVRNLDVKLTEG